MTDISDGQKLPMLLYPRVVARPGCHEVVKRELAPSSIIWRQSSKLRSDLSTLEVSASRESTLWSLHTEKNGRQTSTIDHCNRSKPQ